MYKDSIVKDKNNSIDMLDEYKYPQPYPKIYATLGDKKWLPLLFEDYAGIVSEFGATSQYIFYHFIVDSKLSNELLKRISIAFREISIVEMQHLELLADAIIKIGGIPVFKGYKGDMWNAQEVPYTTSIKNSIELAIKAEEDAIKQYAKHIRIIENISIKLLLFRILKDEQLHKKIFMQLLREVC